MQQRKTENKKVEKETEMQNTRKECHRGREKRKEIDVVLTRQSGERTVMLGDDGVSRLVGCKTHEDARPILYDWA